MAPADADPTPLTDDAAAASDDAGLSEIATDLGRVEYLVVGHVAVDLYEGRMRGWDAEHVVQAVPWAYADAALARADVTIFSIDDLPDPDLRARYIEMGKLVIITENRRGCVVYERGRQPWRSHAFRPSRE